MNSYKIFMLKKLYLKFLDYLVIWIEINFHPLMGVFTEITGWIKTSDFPDAVRQFGVQSLALVYKKDFPNNIYKDQDKIKQWAIAGLNFWTSIQHADGSFDEFYPYERGWWDLQLLLLLHQLKLIIC